MEQEPNDNTSENFTSVLRQQLADGEITEDEFREAWDSWIDHRLEDNAITAQEYLALNQRFLNEHSDPSWFERGKFLISEFKVVINAFRER